MRLSELLLQLQITPAMQSKQDIHAIKSQLNLNIHTLQDLYALPVDDAAAMQFGEQYLLHACEGMLPSFVAK
ncbi:AIR synthase, partial [Klebsiella pneumoniae]|nr:AIR synthase [Klebsiella pneumoniae]